MMAHLQQKYGDTSILAYNAARAALTRPYVSGDIDEYLATHVQAHHACSRANNPLNDIDKVAALISGMGGLKGPFEFTIHQFEEETANLAHRKFEDTAAILATDSTSAVPARLGLASRIRLAAPRILTSDARPAPTTQGYYGAAAAMVPPTTLRDEIVAVLKDILPPLLATTTPAANATATTRAHTPTLYCWTHGHGGHADKDCRRPAPGHDPRATANRRMGGSNRNGGRLGPK